MGMTPYYIMLLFILTCVFTYRDNMPDKNKNRLLIISLLPMFCLLAFKSETMGTDTSTYSRMFVETGDNLNFESRIELGYQYTVILLNRFFGSSQSLYIFSALVICTSLYIFIKRTATNYPLALYFFATMGFFQFSMSGIRQALSIAIILFSFPFIQEKRRLYFFAIIALAFLFHKSAIFFIPMYWIMNMQVNKKNLTYMVFGMVSVYFLAEPFMLTAADMLNYDYGVESTGNGYIFMFIVLLITILCYRSRDVLMDIKKTNSYLINTNYVSLVLWIIRLISRTAERLSLFFMPYTYVALEQYLSSRPANNRKLYIMIAVLIAGYLFIHRMTPSEDLNNFTFYWQ